MEALLLTGNSRKTKLILELSREIGIEVKKISIEQLEDIKLAKEIADGLKTKNVSKAKILKALRN